jgi:hypothetical protein
MTDLLDRKILQTVTLREKPPQGLGSGLARAEEQFLNIATIDERY